MTHEDVSRIESYLDLTLPKAYRDVLLVAHKTYAQFAPDFQYDATEIIITNLELRMAPRENAFAGQSWPSNFVCIGDDGCGNYYAIDVNDPLCSVLFFDHEADEFEQSADSLDSYFAQLAELLEQFPRATEADASDIQQSQRMSGEAAVARTKVPRESVLDPITLDEWTAYVERDPDLQMRGVKVGVNPFTQEEVRFGDPGLAVMEKENSAEEFRHMFGRIYVTRPSRSAIAKLEQIAKALKAMLHTGWSDDN